MKPRELIVRCYAEKSGDLWHAVCIDLNLASQDRSLDRAKRKLDAQIGEYVYDALAGEDRQFADQLLKRKAPLLLRLKYYRFYLVHQVMKFKDGVHQLFTLPVPLVPKRA
jgi:hypothetical protein